MSTRLIWSNLVQVKSAVLKAQNGKVARRSWSRTLHRAVFYDSERLNAKYLNQMHYLPFELKEKGADRLAWCCVCVNACIKQFLDTTHPKELFSGAWVQSAICYLCLLCQIFGTFYRRDHSFNCQEGSQVGCVGGDDDEGEEPPHTANNSPWQRPARQGLMTGKHGM